MGYRFSVIGSWTTFGSTRQMLPVSGAVTNNAPPGPTALPWSSSRPVTSSWAVVATCAFAPLRFSEAAQSRPA
jgi:hypothetical protein